MSPHAGLLLPKLLGPFWSCISAIPTFRWPSAHAHIQLMAAMLMKVIDKHDVAGRIAVRIEDPTAIRRDRKAPIEITVHRKNCPYSFTGEVKVSDGPGRVVGDKIDTSRRDCPWPAAKRSIHL